jgi:actin-related protein
VITDEVGALVFDPGHYSFRAGYAGEDIPKAEIPSVATYVNELGDNAMDIDSNVAPPRKYLIDNPALHVPRKNGEIQTFLKDCMSKISYFVSTA